jgi:uncharacterized protein (DUF2342 family)
MQVGFLGGVNVGATLGEAFVRVSREMLSCKGDLGCGFAFQLVRR